MIYKLSFKTTTSIIDLRIQNIACILNVIFVYLALEKEKIKNHKKDYLEYIDSLMLSSFRLFY